MIKNFYLGGFLYNPTTQKILLRSECSTDGIKTWTLIGGENVNNKVPEDSFLKLVKKLLKIKLNKKDVIPVYDYNQAQTGQKHYIFFAEVRDFKIPESFSWFSLKEISKLKLTGQTKQDIIVGQRVIDSQVRRDAGEQTIG